jgi:hypothetical protein
MIVPVPAGGQKSGLRGDPLIQTGQVQGQA